MLLPRGVVLILSLSNTPAGTFFSPLSFCLNFMIVHGSAVRPLIVVVLWHVSWSRPAHVQASNVDVARIMGVVDTPEQLVQAHAFLHAHPGCKVARVKNRFSAKDPPFEYRLVVCCTHLPGLARGVYTSQNTILVSIISCTP